ncbi:unnamed protein product [Peronospora farinosa]|uniref:Copper transporter n=1 Tax=Peronospora farinosa TaxID=134698 RepID=A0ABN8CCN3_9STRA|nr:unnamed protein product [Peronospora farinosa]
MCDAINAVMQGMFCSTGRLALGAYINVFAYFVIGLPFGMFFGSIVMFVNICKINWKGMADAARVRTS